MLIDVCGPGDILGLEDFVFEAQAHLTYETSVKVTSIVVSRPKFSALLSRHPRMQNVVTLTLAEQVRLRDASLACATHRVKVRLMAFLTRMAKAHGSTNGTDIVIEVGLSHYDVATAIGASEQAVSAAINDLKADGYLSCGYRTVYIKKELPLLGDGDPNIIPD